MEGSASGASSGEGSSSKKMFAIFAVVIVVAAVVIAAFLLMPTTEKVKNIVVADIDGNPESLDPAVDYETVGGELIQNVYETLMFYDGASASALVPQLCTAVPTVENGLITNNGLTYTYNLREGVKFHDGTTMTSADVVYSFTRMLRLNDPHGPAWMVGEMLIPDYYDYGAGEYASDGTMNATSGVAASAIAGCIWAKDAMTVQFNLTVAFPGWNYIITFGVGSVVSKAFVEANGGMNKAGYDYMATHMCGTGAFSLQEFVTSDHSLLKRFDDYWQGKAKISSVLIKQIPDHNTKILMLKSGEADFARFPRSLRSAVEGNPDIRIGEGNGTFNIDFIGLNQNIKGTMDADYNNIPAGFFNDTNVRLAFAHAFDYQKFLTTQFNGSGIQPNGAIPKGMFGYDASVPVFDFNVQKVKDYLENATFVKDSVETNWLDEGFKIQIFYNTGNTVRQVACELFKDGLEAANPGKITVTVTGLEWATFLDKRKKGELPVMFLGWAPDYADPNNYVAPFYLSYGTYASMVGYANATLDAAIEEAAAESNLADRAAQYKQISMDMQKECVFIYTVQATNFNVQRSWISGYVFNPMYSGLYYYPMDKAV